MDAKDYLFYGFGQVAYSLALSDGKVQREEQERLHKRINDGLKARDIEFDYSEIIFDILDDEKVFTTEDTYKEGLKSMSLGSHKLTPELRSAFVEVLEELAESYPPVTSEEKGVITRFRTDLEGLK